MLIYRKQNTITTQSRDGFANETISREGFAGFVKRFQIRLGFANRLRPKSRIVTILSAAPSVEQHRTLAESDSHGAVFASCVQCLLLMYIFRR